MKRDEPGFIVKRGVSQDKLSGTPLNVLQLSEVFN